MIRKRHFEDKDGPIVPQKNNFTGSLDRKRCKVAAYDIVGRGQLQLEAYINSGLLTIHIIQGRKLRIRGDITGSFVKISLRPEGSSSVQCDTQMVPGTSNPIYDEKFSMEIRNSDSNKRLLITVFLYRENSQPIFAGCMSFGIMHLLACRKSIAGWYYILPEEFGNAKHLQAIVGEGMKRLASSLHQGNPNHAPIQPNFSHPIQDENAVPYAVKQAGYDLPVHAGKPYPQFVRPRIQSAATESIYQNTPYYEESYTSSSTCANCFDDAAFCVCGATSSCTGSSVNVNMPGQKHLLNSINANRYYQSNSVEMLDNMPLVQHHQNNQFIPPHDDALPPASLYPVENFPDPYANVCDEENEEKGFVVQLSFSRPSGKKRGYGFTLLGERPAKITNIVKGSISDHNGLRVNDALIMVNGYNVADIPQENIVQVIRSSTKLSLVIYRAIQPKIKNIHQSPWKPRKRREALRKLSNNTPIHSPTPVHAISASQLYPENCSNDALYEPLPMLPCGSLSSTTSGVHSTEYDTQFSASHQPLPEQCSTATHPPPTAPPPSHATTSGSTIGGSSVPVVPAPSLQTSSCLTYDYTTDETSSSLAGLSIQQVRSSTSSAEVSPKSGAKSITSGAASGSESTKKSMKSVQRFEKKISGGGLKLKRILRRSSGPKSVPELAARPTVLPDISASTPDSVAASTRDEPLEVFHFEGNDPENPPKHALFLARNASSVSSELVKYQGDSNPSQPNLLAPPQAERSSGGVTVKRVQSFAMDMKDRFTGRLKALRRQNSDRASQQQQGASGKGAAHSSSSSSQPVSDPKRWQDSFESLLSDPVGLNLFREFLKTEFSEENIEFWVACEEYKQCSLSAGAETRELKARQIHQEFVVVQAPREVNLDSTTRKNLECKLRYANSDADNELLLAQKKVEALMEKDSYPRFLKSDLYQHALTNR